MSVVKRNVVALGVSQAATWIVSIATAVIVPPILGERRFGEFAFVVAYMAIFELIAIFGTGSYLIKTVSRDPTARGQLVVNAATLKLAMSSVVCVVAIGMGFGLGFSSQRMTLIVILSLGVILGSVNNAIIAGLHGIQEMGKPAFWEVVRKVVASSLGIAVLLAGGGLTAFVLAGAWVGIIPLIGNSFALRADLPETTGVELASWRRITVGGAPFFALAGLNLLQGAVDIPMLEALAGTEHVGWYTLALSWVSMPGVLAVVVATAAFPALAAEGAQVNHAFITMANRCLQLVAVLAIPASIAIALTADQFVTLLYGDEFRETVPLMRLLSLEIPLASINVVIGIAIVAADHQRQWVVVALIAAIFNPLTNLVAIPWAVERFGNGGVGAGITTLMTEMIMLAGALRLKPRGVFDRQLRRLVGRIVLASAAMIPIILLLRDLSLFLTVVAAGGVYVGSSLALKTVDADDRQLLRRQLERRRATPQTESTDESDSSPM